jgi:hypothetical protein
MDLVAELKEWAQIFLKSRDAIQKSITGIENLNGDFIVHKTSGDVLFLVRPELSNIDEVVQKASGSAGLVVLNTKKNMDAVIANWDKLAKLKGLCIYFVNPSANEKWLIYPFTHDQITEKPALRRGLESLFSMVQPYQ